MTDEKPKEEAKATPTEDTVANTDDGDKSEAQKQIDRINAETERLNKATAEYEQAKAKAKLGGITSFPAEVPKLSPKEKAKQYGQKVMSGKLE